jgi:N-acetyl-gamma-glutamyl-phosphate reductase
MTRIAILGATGYTAVELVKILLRHPEAEIVAVTSRQEGNVPLAMVHPSLNGRLDLNLENLEVSQIAARAECVFSCLPLGVTAEVAPALLAAGCKVIDFSADYRLDNPEVFANWYGQKHPDPDRLGKVPYGLPELFRDQIVGAQLVANPGCYPTSAILPLSPLLKAGMILKEDLIIDSKSGVSGAGRTLKLTTHYPECNESMSAYNIGRHRHIPEIERILGRLIALGDRYFQIESLYRFNAKFAPRWDPRYLVYESVLGLPRVGLAAMRAEGQLPKLRR